MLVDYIEQSDSDSEKEEMLLKIKPVINHLMEVFNELVESIQVKQDTDVAYDRFDLKECSFDLKECIEKILIGFETQIIDSEAEISIQTDGITDIQFPHKYIESIFSNLISNALKYSSGNRKPLILVKASKLKEDKILLTVSDNGLGIDLKLHKDQLFKIRKTFHLHPSAKGFGLFMTKTQVEAMGGRIWAESEPGEGSTFFIELKNHLV